jgi:hypothetical protein
LRPLAVISPTLYDTATFVKPLTSYTCKLTDPQAAALRTWLQGHNYRFREVPYARFAAEKEKTNVVFYESGKLVVQGKGTQEFVEFALEPEILQEARLGYEAVLNPDLLLPRLGVDESGKGDFFGPLCIAGAYVNESVIKAWAGQRQADQGAGGIDPQDARLRDDGRPHRQRGLQSPLRQDAQRQRHARLGACACNRKPDGAAPSHEPAARAGHQ